MKLIYDFNEKINEEERCKLENVGEIVDVVPTIFPPYYNQFFFSKTISRYFAKEWGRQLNRLEHRKIKIASIHEGCGINPLLFIIKVNPDSDIKEIINLLSGRFKENFNPSSFSYTSMPQYIEKRLGVQREAFKTDQKKLIRTINQNHGLPEKLENIIYRRIKSVTKTNDINKRLSEERKRIQTNYNRIKKRIGMNEDEIMNYVKFIPIINVPILSIIFLRLSSKEYIEILKEDARIIDIYEIVGECDYVVKVYLRNTQDLYSLISQMNKNGCQTVTKCILKTYREEFWTANEPLYSKTSYKKLNNHEESILTFFGRNEQNIIYKDFKKQIEFVEEKNQEVNRKDIINYLGNVKAKQWKSSYKLDRPGWLQHIVFIKATLGKTEEVKQFLREKILGVTRVTFARRYYQITGNYDLLILFDSLDLNSIKDIIEKLKSVDIIEDIRISTIIPEPKDKSVEQIPVKLERKEAAWLNALFPNATKYKDLKTVPSGRTSTRERVYEYELYKSLESANYKTDFKEISTVDVPRGVNFVTELHPHKMLHTFIRFKIINDKFNDKIKEKEEIFGAFLSVYKPIHDPNVIMCFLATEDFQSLLDFVKDLDEYCRFTEISFIFDKGFPAKVPEYAKCKPCIYKSGVECEACRRYPIEPEKIAYRVKEISDYFKPKNKGQIERNVKVAVVQLKINENVFIRLMKEHTSKAYKDEYTKKVIGYLKEAISKDSKIVVFPELSIPDCVAVKIEEELKEIIKNSADSEPAIIVVAGSHYKLQENELIVDRKKKKFYRKNRVYNLCPIFFCSNDGVERFDQYKNNSTSDIEVKFFNKLINNKIFLENAELSEGKGCQIFHTKYGRFSVLICRDKVDDNLTTSLGVEVDLIIVPSWDGNKPGTINELESIAKSKNLSWVVFANNGKEGGSRLFGPVIKSKAITKEAKDSLKAANKSSEEIKYLILENGIRKFKGGERYHEGEHYCYMHEKPLKTKRT